MNSDLQQVDKKNDLVLTTTMFAQELTPHTTWTLLECVNEHFTHDKHLAEPCHNQSGPILDLSGVQLSNPIQRPESFLKKKQ